MIDIIDKSREQVYVCIGTMRTPLDSIAPRVGTMLRTKGFNVIGTEDSTVNAHNVDDIMPDIVSLDPEKYQVIGIDAMLGTPDMPTVIAEKSPCRPAFGMGASFHPIGEATIGANLGYCTWYDDIIKAMIESYDNAPKDVDVTFANLLADRIYYEILKAVEVEP